MTLAARRRDLPLRLTYAKAVTESLTCIRLDGLYQRVDSGGLMFAMPGSLLG